MDSLGSLLPHLDEPPESKAIKNYIKEKFDQPASVTVRDKQIIIIVNSAALAGSLRLQITKLQEASGSDKKIFIRIGQL